jgi:hypothetical protein
MDLPWDLRSPIRHGRWQPFIHQSSYFSSLALWGEAQKGNSRAKYLGEGRADTVGLKTSCQELVRTNIGCSHCEISAGRCCFPSTSLHFGLAVECEHSLNSTGLCPRRRRSTRAGCRAVWCPGSYYKFYTTTVNQLVDSHVWETAITYVIRYEEQGALGRATAMVNLCYLVDAVTGVLA